MKQSCCDKVTKKSIWSEKRRKEKKRKEKKMDNFMANLKIFISGGNSLIRLSLLSLSKSPLSIRLVYRFHKHSLSTNSLSASSLLLLI